MQLAKLLNSRGQVSVGRVRGDTIELLDLPSGNMASLAAVLASDEVSTVAASLPSTGEKIAVKEARLLPPIDRQEVWAAGVTYKRSQTARMEESEAAASCYDRVYQSPRPEIFFKATPHRVRGSDDALRIRSDARWNVPEPELALVLSPRLQIVGYTIGNDMSSRDIEGDNPLYLPQAKLYDQCCGLGPWITLADSMPPRESLEITLDIQRQGESVFDGQTSVSQMARGLEELVGWLGRDNSFPNGAFLLTGTGIVPDSDFTLQPGDNVRIHISGIGTLSNTIVQG
ncbi:MAG: fumarylacetoacetate hydrolase family protein [Pirellulaceae bacterium]|jgi:2-dehydro-3-deoxy-D-arabinonate dehydratase|nr:fumarylacetoacetate hydrolase family protein [Pirellulaceae bacterium]